MCQGFCSPSNSIVFLSFSSPLPLSSKNKIKKKERNGKDEGLSAPDHNMGPGVGSFSVPAESSLLFCFPQVLAFLSLIKICGPPTPTPQKKKAGSFLLPCLSLALSLQLCYQPPLSCECLLQELLKWPASLTAGCGWSQLSLALIR